jgi:hypothetical protein
VISELAAASDHVSENREHTRARDAPCSLGRLTIDQIVEEALAGKLGPLTGWTLTADNIVAVLLCQRRVVLLWDHSMMN